MCVCVSVCVWVCVYVCLQYGSHALSEDTPVGRTLLTVKATDADDPGTGSSRIEYHITAGNEDGVFAMETDPNGEGRVVLVKV